MIGHRFVETGGILRVAPGDGVQHERGVAHRFGERADLIERGRECDQAETRHAAISWLQPHDAAQRRRLADRTAGVGTERGERLIRRHHRRRTAARTARNTSRVPRIAGMTKGGIFRRAPHGKLIQIAAPERNCARRAQLADHRGIIVRAVSFQNLRRRRAGFAAHVDHVFDGDGHAAQRERNVRVFRAGERRVEIPRKVAVNLRIDARDAFI